MTFRAKPVVKRAQKHSWESRDRRNFYLNLGFGLVVAAAVLILLIAAGLTWYNDHLAPVGSVDGQSITKDEFADRVNVERWRLDEASRRISNAKNAGRLTESQAQLQTSIVDQQREQLAAIALERIIDTRIQAKLAVDEGITATPADVDARLIEEATIPESRHAWVIEVEPVTDPDAAEPDATQKAEAKAKAETALRDLQSGKPWDEVAKAVSTDASSAPQAGDLGWLQRTDGQADESYLEAIFAAEVDSPTAIVEGEDGILRIGRVTEVSPETVDPAYTAKIENDGLDLEKYRAVVIGDVIHQKLEDKVVAEATKPGAQREASEIYLSTATADLPPEAVKVRHILYSPKDDPNAASAGEIPADDPSWRQAEVDANAAYAKLQADPTRFDAIARAESDEEIARGETGSGGTLDAYVSADGSYVDDFSTPILAANAADGQILAPIKTDFGYHVVQIVRHGPDLAEIKAQIDGGTDFGVLAKELSEGPTADSGGDLGWIAKGQLDERLTSAIFAAPIGKTSDVVVIPEDGQYLFRVAGEETRTPEGRQLEDIKSTAFSSWYGLKQQAVPITRDELISGVPS
jgi:parvulin-like peptidyl-prolyl isomerase